MRLHLDNNKGREPPGPGLESHRGLQSSPPTPWGATAHQQVRVWPAGAMEAFRSASGPDWILTADTSGRVAGPASRGADGMLASPRTPNQLNLAWTTSAKGSRTKAPEVLGFPAVWHPAAIPVCCRSLWPQWLQNHHPGATSQEGTGETGSGPQVEPSPEPHVWVGDAVSPCSTTVVRGWTLGGSRTVCPRPRPLTRPPTASAPLPRGALQRLAPR